ncbi:hypothetical protein [Tenacibaculum singaporense]|uniref:Pycsar effector protein domain-containing protein n=1 Tax=Tenacibaculum singaporense TaxID=2358479 RepID=A0A3Q8RQY9_9FLAO|nr:hypothetical protein [Tenacibaculum singaporense]AZJ34127.1 hypothetical protein D6T69_00720 [Tenacibaculum singaporense]RSC95644.1 hypothetical protein EI424_00600 [Tenacibaculum singaporense]
MTTKETELKESIGLFTTKKEPRKSFATYQRNQNKFYLSTLNLIDRKAAIMLKVNATILSASVIFFNYITEINFGVKIAIILIITSFISLIFSILASKPNSLAFYKRFKRDVVSKYKKREENLFMIGMSSGKTLEEYEKAYNKVLNSQELQIGNQVRTMFLLEKEMKRGYFYLELAYSSFLIGLLILILVLFFANI